jgi:hypothetical protein
MLLRTAASLMPRPAWSCCWPPAESTAPHITSSGQAEHQYKPAATAAEPSSSKAAASKAAAAGAKAAGKKGKGKSGQAQPTEAQLAAQEVKDSAAEAAAAAAKAKAKSAEGIAQLLGAKSELPVMLPDKLQRNKILLELEPADHQATDLSGDAGGWCTAS